MPGLFICAEVSAIYTYLMYMGKESKRSQVNRQEKESKKCIEICFIKNIQYLCARF